MKKVGVVTLAVLVLFSFTSCTVKFNGNRTGNDSQLIMDYSVFNTTDEQQLKLEKGDIVDVDIVSDSGEVDVVVKMEGEEAIYDEKDVQTSSFEISIPKSGIYRFAVTGDGAKGSVSFMKRRD